MNKQSFHTYPTHGPDEATNLGFMTREAVGVGIDLVHSGTGFLQHFVNRLIWQDRPGTHDCGCRTDQGCRPLVQHHYCVQWQPAPSPCHRCC